MNLNHINNVKDSYTLYELSDELSFLIDLFERKKLPKVLMLSGKKGVGKSTIVNHFLTYVFDKENYNYNKKIINNESSFYKRYINNTFSEIIYLEGSSHKNVKVDDIRILKSNILKSLISEKQRFIILDDVELFNTNSLNALLKIIEEPTKNNFFILINNKTRPLLETIHSRSIEIIVSLTNAKRKKIIQTLIQNKSLNVILDFASSDLTPGNYLSFNDICFKNEIDINSNYIETLEKLLFFYKKNKDINIINFILFFTERYFYTLLVNKDANFDRICDTKNFIIKNISEFVLYNLNQNSLINAINLRLSNE